MNRFAITILTIAALACLMVERSSAQCPNCIGAQQSYPQQIMVPQTVQVPYQLQGVQTVPMPRLLPGRVAYRLRSAWRAAWTFPPPRMVQVPQYAPMQQGNGQ